MGRALGSQYVLGELLGSGAMGKVHEGVDHSGRRYAFKLLRSDLVDDPEFISRFHQERSMLVNIRGEHLVAVHDLVVEGSTAAIVMDLVPGGNLRDLLVGAGTILPAEVARIGSGIADALHKVHLADIVHRDVKPENVLMDSSTPTRTPKLTDFGISKMTGGSKVGRSTLLAGTPNYVAPEIANGQQITPAADLYSLGIVLYELCCGVTPFESDSVFQVLRSHGEMMPGRPEDIPDDLWNVIWSLLQKNPAARPQSAGQVSAVLAGLADRLWRAEWPVGARLDKPPPPVPLSGQGNNNETVLRMPVNAPAPVGRRKRRLPVVLTAVVLLGAVGGGGYFLASNGSTEADPPPLAVGGGDSGVKTTQPTAAGRATTTTTDIKLTTMPDLVGKKLGEARDKLPKDMNVDVVDQVDEKNPDGTVLSQEPAAGEPVDGTAKLVVARPAVTIYLDSVKPASGQWGRTGEPVGLGGKQYLHALGSTLNNGCIDRDNYVAEYNLSKGYRRFVTSVGISDDAANTETKVQLEIFADNRQIAGIPVEFGTVVPVDLDLTDVLRLRFQWQGLSRQSCSRSGLALGEAKLLGLAGEVPTSGLPPTSTSATKPTTTTTR